MFTEEDLEEHTDNSLAPRTWDSYIGQKKVKQRLQLAIEGALSRYEMLKHVLLLGPPGTGKGHPHGTPILTPEGWVNIEDLEVGDDVIGSNGKKTKLIGKFNRGVLDVYRVHFNDGSWVDCDPDHIWWAKTKNGSYKEYTVSELLKENLRTPVSPSNPKKKPAFKYSIPMVEAVQFEKQDVLIHPYILGALLANGNLNQAIITTNDLEIIKNCESVAPSWLTFTEYPSNPARRWKLNDYNSGHNINRVLNHLGELGLRGVKSRDKFIPKQYLVGSIEQRVSLLQALMDCDGSQRGSHTSYHTYSVSLAEGVQSLVQSLGGTASISKQFRDNCYEYTVAINLKEFEPFTLSRKLEVWQTAAAKSGTRRPGRRITNLERRSSQEVICLQVDAEDQLYVTNNYIVTHNTSLAEIIAKELQADLLALTMTPNFKMHYLYKRIQDFDGGVIFLDEIHCLSTKNQHYLLDVLEKNKMTYDSGKVECLTSPITFIAATTEMDKLIKPMHHRFHHIFVLDDYSDLEMAQIVERMALQLDLTPDKESCKALGKASAGVPRQARRLVYAAQDLGGLDKVDDILTTCGITRDGLTEDHVAYLKTLLDLGCKAGMANIANHSQRPRDIVEDLEKLLIKKGYVEITRTGRELSTSGLKALKAILSSEEEEDSSVGQVGNEGVTLLKNPNTPF